MFKDSMTRDSMACAMNRKVRVGVAEKVMGGVMEDKIGARRAGPSGPHL